MKTLQREKFVLREHNTEGGWFSDDKRFYEAAKTQLAKLEKVAEEVTKKFPIPKNKTLSNGRNHSELWELTRERDLLSDSVIIFSAMAVEGFLNFYGVVRIGEREYQNNFERMGYSEKLRTLLLVCDAVILTKKDPLIKILDRISNRRNSLVHPKATEFSPHNTVNNNMKPIPDRARLAVEDMDNFFKEFLSVVPEAWHLVPNLERNIKI